MYDMSMPAKCHGDTCPKCKGSGVYCWGPCINGEFKFSGKCNSCAGKGYQTSSDIARDNAYNRHKLASMGLGR